MKSPTWRMFSLMNRALFHTRTSGSVHHFFIMTAGTSPNPEHIMNTELHEGAFILKKLDLNTTVYDATIQYPELIGIISGLGFPQIRNAYLRRVIGRKFTLNEAIAELGLNRQRMISILRQRGFDVAE